MNARPSRRNNLAILLISISATAGLSDMAQCQVLPPPPVQPRVDRNGVDVQTGNIFYEKKELSIGPDDIHGLQYMRHVSGGATRSSFSSMREEHINYLDGTYSLNASFGNRGASLGAGATSNLGDLIEGQTYIQKDGTIIPFNHHLLDQYDPNSMQYDSFDLADYIEFPDGTRWTLHYRDGFAGGRTHSRVQSVTSNTGFQLKFTYATDTLNSDGSNYGSWEMISRVTAINNAVEYCNPDADSCALSNPWPYTSYSSTYSASSSTNVETVTGPRGDVTQYTSISGSPATYAIKTAGSSYNNFVYNTMLIYNPCFPASPYCRVGFPVRVTNATINGQSTSYSYSALAGNSKAQVVANGPLSSVDTYISDTTLIGITSYKDSANRASSFSYNSGIVTSATFPESNALEYQLDTRGNITQSIAHAKPGSGLADISQTSTFDACTTTNRKICNKPISVTDPRSATTNYTYDATHGGVLTESGPAVDGIRPVKRYAYIPRYAWIKNAGGAFVAAPTPIYLVSEVRTCRTSATVGNSCSAGSSDELVESYDYGPDSGPNNLLLRGKTVTADGSNHRTCYSYDMFGNLISTTRPNANPASCS